MPKSTKRGRRPQGRSAQGFGFRRYLMEGLEQRLVLSGAHDAALLAAIDNALISSNPSGLSTFATRLKDTSATGRNLPLVGTGLTSYDGGAVLKSLLNRLGPTYSTLPTLAAALEGGAGIADGINVSSTRDNPDNLELDVHFNNTTNVGIPIAGSYGINLSVGGSVTVATTLDFQLTVGAYWDAGSSSAVFYVLDTNDVLQISTGVVSASMNATGALGVVDLAVTGGSAAFSPAFSFSLIDQATPGQPGRMTLSQLSSVTVPSLVATTVTSAAPTSLTVNFNAALAPTAHSLTVSWADVTKPTVATSTLGTDPTLSQLNAFQGIAPTTYSQGLDNLVQIVGEATTSTLTPSNPFLATLPLLNKSFGSVLNVQQLLTTALTSHTDSTTNAQNQQVLAFATAGQLLTLLRNLPGVGVANATMTATASDVRFTLTLPAGSVQSLPLTLGISPQLNLPATGTMSVTMNTTTNVTFGVDTTNKFFILDTGSPLLNAALSATATLNGTTNLGFLGVTITSGTASITGSATLALKDPQTDIPATPGVISSTEMTGANLNAMAVPAVSGTAAASLPLSTTLAALSAVTGTLTANWANITAAQTFTTSAPALTQYLGFNNITPAIAINGLGALPAVIAHAGDVAYLGENLAFLGSSVGTGAALSTPFQTMVNALTNIKTAQDLQSTLNAYFGAANVTVSVTGSDVEFGVTQTQTVPGTLKFAVNVTEPGSGDGFQTTGSVSATGTYTNKLLVGLGFAQGLSDTDRFYVIPGASSALAASFKVQQSGTLSAPATLGYLNVNIAGGTATVVSAINAANNATLTVPYVVPGGVGTQITLTKLQANPTTAALGTPAADGRVSLTLPLTGLPSPGSNPQIGIVWANMAQPGTVVVTPSNLGDVTPGSNYSATSASSGIQSVINLINGWSNISLLNTNIPLVGSPVKSVFNFIQKGTSFFQAVINAGVSTPAAFNTAVQNAITNAGLDAGSVTLTAQPDNNPATSVFHYLLNFHYNVTGISEPFNFGSTLFSLNGNVTAGVQFNANIEFGLDKINGFYLVDRSNAGTPEVSLSTGVTGAFNKIGGNFGPVSYGVANGTASVTFNLGLDLVSPQGAGGKIGPGDLANNIAGVAQPEFLSGSGGNLDLPLGFFLGTGGPGVATEFKANWNPTSPGAFYFGTGNSTNPVDGFSPVQFELGDFVSGIIGPLVHDIQQYNPLPQKLIDLLNYQLPLLGKTPGDILGDVAGLPGFSLLFKIAGVISELDAITGGGTLNLSNYLSGAPNTGTLPGVAGQGGTPAEQSPFQSLLNDLESNYGISIPVLANPTTSIISILLGQDVKLIEFKPGDNGHVEISKSLTSPKITIPIFSIGFADASVFAEIGGSVGIFANIDLGIDSSGLSGHTIDHSHNILDGFFIGNTDRFQVGFEGQVFLNLGGQIDIFGIPIVQVYGRLGLKLDLGLHVDDVAYQAPGVPVDPPAGDVEYGDPGGDGRVTYDELNHLISTYGLACTLEFGGQLSLFGGIGFRGPDIPFIGPIPDIFKEIGSIPIIDFNIPCTPPPPTILANIVGNSLVMVPDSGTAGKHVDLNVYYDANEQPKGVTFVKYDDGGTINQSFTFAQLAAAGVTNLVVEGTNGDDKIRIDPMLTSDYNFQTVAVNTHNGNDSLQWGGIDKNTTHLLATTITAGDGNDTISGTFRPDSISVGNGADIVLGLEGNDTIQSGNGNSTIQGGAGNDLLIVGGGQNTVNVGDGNNTIFVGNGGNLITGGKGNNTVHGGAGGDKYYLGDGGNSVLAGSGNDVIYVGNGANYVSTGAGDDKVFALDGNNTIQGGIGNDQINAGQGNNNIYGLGNNTIKAGDGKDFVSAGPGNNIILLGNGDNKVLAGNGANFVSTGRGQDIMQLGGGPDTVQSGAGDDFIQVGLGNDAIDGGTGTNLLQVIGNANFTIGNSSVAAAGAGTVIYNNIQRLTVTGGVGNNTFDVSPYTSPQPVIIDGNGGTDTLVSSDNLNFVLTDTSLTRSDNTAFSLKGISQAILTGGTSDNSFDVGSFTGPVTVDGGIAAADYNRIIDTIAGTYTLTNSSLTRSTGAAVTLLHINRATLPGGTSVVNSAGFSGLVDLTGGGGSPPTLSGSTDSFGRWTELGLSASNGGVSNSPATAIEPAIATSSAGQYVAWADNRNGNFQIYVAEHTAGGWVQLSGSAQGGGISGGAGNARRPSITLDGSGNPIVAWTETVGASSDIQVATYSGGNWVALGTSLAAGGISGDGVADSARVVNTAGGPVVAWLDRAGGVANIYVKLFTGGVWSALGAGATSGAGVSASATAVAEFSLATDGTNVAVAWTQTVAAATQIYLKQYSGGVWNGLTGSASGNGLSNTAGSAAQPSVAYSGGVLLVAYQATVGGQSNVAANFNTGVAWSSISIDTPTSAGNSVTRGAASVPQLFSAGGTLELVWLERRLAGTTSQDTEIYANKFNGASFVRVLPGDASYNGIHWTSSAVSGLALSVDSTGRPFVAWGDTSSGSSEIYALGATFAIHTVYYVNDGLTPDDSYTSAAGASGNTGLTASSPLDSVQSVLSKYALSAGDVILVDSGTYSGFTLSGAPSGILIMGSGGVPSTLAGAVSLTNAQGDILQSLTLNGGLNVTSGTNVQLSNLIVSNLTVSGGTGNRLEHSSLASLTLAGGSGNAVIVNNVVSGLVLLGSGGTTNVSMSGNRVTGGMSIAVASSGTITANDISGGGTALNITAAFTGSIDHNFIHNASVGVNYAAAAPLNANRIYSNTTGVTASVNGNTTGLGFLGGSVANEIYFNSTGVNLSGSMQLQHVFSNSTGVTGSGVLGGAILDSANLVELNTTGVNFTGTIQFNRIARNTVGIQATSGQVVIHNLVYRNLTAGVDTGGATDVRIWNNTFYSTAGNNISVDGGSSNVQALNNILWSTGGYDLFVADNSRSGFFSDYNDLYTTGSGKIVHWLVDFADVLDWQVNVNRFDLHSIGTTAVNPTWAQPQFTNLARDNFQTLGLAGALRASSPTIDTGAAFSDVGLPASYTNLLANASFESGLGSWTASVGAGTQSSSPSAFTGTSYFYGGAVASAFAQQTVSLTGAGFGTAQLDGQGLVLVFGGRVRSAAGENPADQGRLIVTFLDGSNNPIGLADTVPATNANDRWELIGDRLHVPVGARSVTYRFEALRQTGSTDDSYLDGAFVYVIPSTTAPDQGAYGNTVNDVDLGTAHLHMVWPDLYTDWELSTPHNIQWATFGTGGAQISLDLYQDNAGTPQFLMHIATVPDTGSYTWIPGSPLTYGTYGLRIQASLATNSAIYDRSSETFTIPENGHSFYVNDASTTGDVYTAAVGSNRNTGKLPTRPKPLLTSLLRVYNLGGSDTIYVDTGNYSHFDPVVLSGNPAVGGDQGVTITGPTNAANIAQINTLGFTSPAVFDVNNGNFVTLSHLSVAGGDYGVWARNTSSNFTGNYLTISGATFDGIRLEANSSANSSLDHITSLSNGRDGISVGGNGVNLTNSISHNNLGAGVRYDNSGNAVLTGNMSYANKWGMLITNSTFATAATVGKGNLALGLGNIVHDNAVYGIYASGGATVAGNTVYGIGGSGGAGPAQLSAAPAVGQYLGATTTYYYRVTAITPAGETISSPEGSASGNTGVALSWTAVPGATGYNIYRGGSPGSGSLVTTVGGLSFLDTGALFIGTSLPGANTIGIDLLGGATGAQNVVYNTYLGIYSNGGAVTNNRVFATAGAGIYSSNSAATGNVSYSNSVGIEGDNSPTWTNNLIYANSTAGFWLHSGFSANIFNNTIYDVTGDGVRVESSGGNFQFQHVNIRNNIIWVQGGYGITVTPLAEIGFQSDYNDLYVTGTAQVGLWESVGRATLNAWRLSAFTDTNSISADPLFVNPAGADGQFGSTNFADHGTDDDFHEKSIAGSFHGGALAPVVSAGTGLPVALPGTLTNDAVTSPAVDRGDPASSFANETAPNGGFINLGAFGNTVQASNTFIPYVLVLGPNGGETLVEGQTFNITWRSEVATGTATIDLMNGATVVQNIATGVANIGVYAWAIPTSIPAGNYTIRVTRNSVPVSSDLSDATFALSGPIHAFYVNDATVAVGDFTTAPGNDTNSGLDPGHPKASIRALLNAYNLGAGDVVFVDEGTYPLSSNIVIPASRAGVTIRGFYDPANPTHVSLINRNSTAAGSDAFDVQAINVTLDRLSITGADVGINVVDGGGITGLTVSNSDIYGNFDYDIYLGSTNGNAYFNANKIHDTNGFYKYGLYSSGNRITVTRNAVYNNPRYGIYVQSGQGSLIAANTAYNNGFGIAADTSSLFGNISYNNVNVGITVSGNSNVTGNTTYGNPQYGIQATGGYVQNNISYGNQYGVYATNSTLVANNRLYGNSLDGVYAGGGVTASGNVVYSNGVGIEGDSSPQFLNNVIYGNTTAGIWLHGGVAPKIANNTIYQTTGDGIRLESTNFNLQFQHMVLRNNIVWVAAGYDVTATPNSSFGFDSDYNDFYSTGTGQVGFWQNVAQPNLIAWQQAALVDGNTISTDPLFVNVAGGDFHEQSVYGSFHGWSPAPVLNVSSGLPSTQVGTLVNDAVQSPVIDRGDSSYAYANETAPNGGFVNLGAFGNTAQASRSPATYMLVTKPGGGETWIEGQTFNIKWRDHNIGTGLVDIDLMVLSGGVPAVQSNIITGVVNNGQYAWTPASSIPAGSNYLIRVTEEGGGPAAVSLAAFSLAAPTHIYYVNDATFQSGDWTTAAGNDASSGIDSAHPKASVAGVLSAYTMHSGDTIMVDAGTYNLTGDIVLKLAQSGITIEGYNNPSFPTRQAVLNRGNTSSGTAIVLNGATNVTIDHLGLTGGLYGFATTYQVVSDSATISNCEIFANSSYAMYLLGGSNNITVTNCYIHNDDQGITSNYNTNVTVTNNTISNVRLRGISISSNGGTISGNTVTGISGVAAIEAYGGQGYLTTVSNNVVHDNTTTGIIIGSYVLATGNTAYNQTTSGVIGIQVAGGEARGNLSYNNYYGIYITGGLADQNRTYHNSTIGVVVASGATASYNQVYSNPVGIQGDYSPNILNNLVYANTTRGIYVTNGGAAQVLNNTVYQPAGDALDLLSSENNLQFQHMLVMNNVLWAQAGYDLNLSDDAAIGFQSDYNDLYVSGTGKVARISNRDYPALSDWLYEYGFDSHSISADPRFVNAAGPDGVLGYTTSDFGADDNFHLQSTSPAIDAGNPVSNYFNEPGPNGSRVNLGHLGNTTQADPSPAPQSVQVTSPTSLQKLEAGKQYTLTWQTAGVTTNQPVLLIDSGGPTIGFWSADAFATSPNFAKTIANAVDTSGVTDPAPQAVYQSYIFPNSGSEISYMLPVADGTYTLRLHFMDEVPYVGKPVFNIKVNGSIVKSNFDVFAAAGAAYKAVTLTLPNLSATGGTGLLVELVSVSGPPILSAIELSAANPSPVPSPTTNLQVSTDSGNTWTTIATNQPIDSYGRGSFLWTPSTTTTGPSALFRVSVNGTSLTGTSAPFAIYSGGNDYYVNDSSQVGDVFTTAVGNNANSGKSPNSPLADIQAVLTQYNPGAGAVIHVDTGTYVLVHDLNLASANNGLTIQGPSGAAAVINRANTADHVFTFGAGANNITLDHLSITGGSAGVYAEYSQNSVGNTVSNNQIYGNGVYGVFLGGSDTGWTLTSNSIHDNSGLSSVARGIDVESTLVTITNNTVYNETQAIYAQTGLASIITGNLVYASSFGIQAVSATVGNNTVHDNTSAGIYASGGALVLNNTVYRQTAANAAGILLQGAEARGNAVFGNYNGIVTQFIADTIDRNRVYSNTNFGINLGSNSTGSVFDNLVYANSAAGVVVSSSSGVVLTDNTVYQLVGDALRFTTSPNAIVRGNILWVEAGYDLNVSADSQSGFVSDYNDAYKGAGASAHVGFWAGAAQDTLALWTAASAKDAHSIASDPKFVNVKGADQVLGYNPAGVGYDGGLDDNFYLSSGSPAIDHGYSWGPSSDLLSQPRSDDPGTTNAGSGYYLPAVQASSSYALLGSPQNWRTYGSYFNYTFTGGFTFPFYDATYTSVQVASSGFLQFAGPDFPTSFTNSDAALLPDRRIAALWDNIRTDLTGNDIYLYTDLPGQVKFTWKGTNVADGTAVNFSIVLFSNGQIRFDYGGGNTNLTPTVGISMGDGINYTFPAYDNATTLTNANSILWTLPPGFADMGAYEFLGSGADTTPPTITGATPSAIQSGGAGAPVSQITLNFSKPLNLSDAIAPSEYHLGWAGPDGVFGNADDVTYSLTPQYTVGATFVTLTPVGGGTLPSGLYQLTVNGALDTGIHDLSGNALDGDANGTAGGNYFRQFTLGYPAANTIGGTAGVDQIAIFQDADHVHIDWTMNTIGGQILTTDPNGLTINGVGSNDVITLNFANGNPLPGVIHFNGTFTINGMAGVSNPLAGKKLDIGQSTLYFNYAGNASLAATIQQYIAGGYNGGAWNGTPTVSTGVISSAAAASGPAGAYAVGFADSADGIVVGQPANTVEVRYTVMGDANLDRVVNSTDAILLARNYLLPGKTAWDLGNFNYDSTINMADATLLQKNYNAVATGSAAPATSASATSASATSASATSASAMTAAATLAGASASTSALPTTTASAGTSDSGGDLVGGKRVKKGKARGR